MGWRDKVRNSKQSFNTIWPVPGQYKLKVLKIKEKEAQAGSDLVITEFYVLESSVEARPVGSQIDWILDFKFPSTPADVMSWFCVLGECSEAEVTDEAMKMITGPTQPFAGKIVNATFFNKKTTKGGDFTAGKFVLVQDEAKAA